MDDPEDIDVPKMKSKVYETLFDLSDIDIMLLYQIAVEKFPKHLPTEEMKLCPEQIRVFFILEMDRDLESLGRLQNLLRVCAMTRPLLSKIIDSVVKEESDIYNIDIVNLLSIILARNGTQPNSSESKAVILAKDNKKLGKFS